MSDSIRVAIAGHGLMARVHAHAWRTMPYFFQVGRPVEVAVLLGTDPERTQRAADSLHIRQTETDVQRLIARGDIDILDICAPGDAHARLTIPALEARVHVLCEKPVGTSLEDSRRMADAASKATAHGVVAMAGYNLRHVPAIQEARALIRDGALGSVISIRGQYLQDWLTDPATPMSWRLRKERAGYGALGDIGSHIIDLAQYLVGEDIVETIGYTRTEWAQRPTDSSDGGHEAVTVDDSAAWLGRFSQGSVGTFEASRVSHGHHNQVRIEIDGTRGALAFDFERMNELLVAQGGREPGTFRKLDVTGTGHPYGDVWWPAGLGLAYDHTFVHLVAAFIDCVETGTRVSPSFRDAHQVQSVLASIESSTRTGRWVSTAS
jgi:predicted dehydrogenase